MDDELRQWSAAWKTMEVREMGLVKKHLDAHRREESKLKQQLVLFVGIIGLVAAVLSTMSLDVALARPGSFAIIAAGVVILIMLLRAGTAAWRLRDLGRRRAALTDAPTVLVRELISFEERKLRQSTDRKILAAICMWAAYGGFVLGTNLDTTAMSFDRPRSVAIGVTMSVGMALAIAIMGRRTARRARGELETLRALRDELAGAPDEATEHA
ncbi:MAG: hypothetical protein M3Y87_17710 [Myxococcota bacterium]|nr:hypothetical protein [Myxococcota bacterium]